MGFLSVTRPFSTWLQGSLISCHICSFFVLHRLPQPYWRTGSSPDSSGCSSSNCQEPSFCPCFPSSSASLPSSAEILAFFRPLLTQPSVYQRRLSWHIPSNHSCNSSPSGSFPESSWRPFLSLNVEPSTATCGGPCAFLKPLWVVSSVTTRTGKLSLQPYWQCPAQHLGHSGCSTTICWMNVWRILDFWRKHITSGTVHHKLTLCFLNHLWGQNII